jgi:3',5'-cyclic AMP phosphodiesterase CpdA
MPELSNATTSVRDRIAHIADLHFWRVTLNPLRLASKRALGNLNVIIRRRREYAMHRAAELLSGISECGAKHVVMTGDFSSTSLDEEFVMAREFVDTILARGMRVTLMPGNHDVYTFEAQRQKRFEHFFGDLIPEHGTSYKLSLPGGTPLIVVPTVCANILSARGIVTNTAIERVSSLLADCTGPVLVAGHYPMLSKTPGYTLTRGRRMRNADGLRLALGKTEKRILYMAGHVHRHSVVRDPFYPHLTHVTTGAFFRRAHESGIEGEFTIIDVLAGNYDVTRMTFSKEWSAEAAAR